ncbi:MAG: BlaI/MecI/CopY family transcriptional regulator [Cyclobacteriaceae bacterium]
MKELTKAEEQVMNYLWKLEKAYLKDIVAQFPEPAPAYTTISTVVNVLVKKSFIGFELHGKAKLYQPMISKKNYTRHAFKGMLSSFFNDSPQQFASFFTQENDLDLTELQELKSMIEDQISKQKEDK